MVSAIAQPSSASGSAFARVRFQTVTSSPALASRPAIAAPMRPAPIQPTVKVSRSEVWFICSLCNRLL